MLVSAAGRVQPGLQWRRLYLKDLRRLHRSGSLVITVAVMNHSETGDVICQVDIAPKYVTLIFFFFGLQRSSG